MTGIYLDSCRIIYFTEGHEAFHTPVSAALRSVIGGPTPLRITDLTRLECRTGPLRKGDAGLLSRYDRFFDMPGVSRVELTTAVFDLATELRARHSLRTPDALHLAAALSAGCTEFWTSDTRLADVARQHLMVRIPTA
jgi:predicted nucleic acid-binding protein